MKDKKQYFAKMLGYVKNAQKYIGGLTYEDFVKDEKTVSACAFAIFQIGEQTGKFDQKERERYPIIPWIELRGLRNRIVHEYDSVDSIILWDIMKNYLPKLASDIEQIL